MMQIPFKQVDVFTAVPFKGNPVAVVLDAAALSTEQMQQIACWTNLSETTFVVPATDARADYQVRIFTPDAELPFAGHPTIGTAHALLEAGLIDVNNGVLIQQSGVGLVHLAVEQGRDGSPWISFELPEPKLTALDDEAVRELELTLGVSMTGIITPPYLVDVGPRWIVAQLASAQAVMEVQPDLQRMKIQNRKGNHTGVVIFGPHNADASADIEVRAFAPAVGIDEDPVCGSGNGCVAAYIRHTGQTAEFGSHFLASQGAALGRAGRLKLAIAGGAIRIAGNAITCIHGSLYV